MPEPEVAPQQGPQQPIYVRLKDGTVFNATGKSREEVDAFLAARKAEPSSIARGNMLTRFRASLPQDAASGPPAAPAAPVQKPQGTPMEEFFSKAWEEFNPLQGIEGISKFMAHPAEALLNMQEVQKQVAEQGYKDLKEGRTALGQSRIAFSRIPVAGPLMNKVVTEWVNGNRMGAVGTAVGAGASFAVPEALGGAIGKTAARAEQAVGRAGTAMYDATLGGVKGMSSAERAAAVAEGASKKILPTEAGMTKAMVNTEDGWRELAKQAASDSRTVPTTSAMRELNDLRKQSAGDPATLEAIDIAQDRLLGPLKGPTGKGAVRNMTAKEAVETVERTAKRGDPGITPTSTPAKVILAQQKIAKGIVDQLMQDLPELGEAMGNQTTRMNLERMVGESLGSGAAKKALGEAAVEAGVKMLAGGSAKLLHSVLTARPVRAYLGVQLARGLKGTGRMAGATAKLTAYAAALGNQVDDEEP